MRLQQANFPGSAGGGRVRSGRRRFNLLGMVRTIRTLLRVAADLAARYAFEAIGFAATLFSPSVQAAAAIYSTSISIFYQIPLGLGAAGAIRVGNLLGRGLPHKAALSSKA